MPLIGIFNKKFLILDRWLRKIWIGYLWVNGNIRLSEYIPTY